MVDIAREAGVSLATVDRVLNGRDGVNAETATRVQAVVQRLNYAPNLAASLLSRGRTLQFDIVLPAGSNTFIRDLGEAVLAAERDFTAFGVKPRLHLIEGFDPGALAEALRRVGRGSDGIGFIALDHPAVREAVAERPACRSRPWCRTCRNPPASAMSASTTALPAAPRAT
jgi:LacI family transcriptional regulator